MLFREGMHSLFIVFDIQKLVKELSDLGKVYFLPQDSRNLLIPLLLHHRERFEQQFLHAHSIHLVLLILISQTEVSHFLLYGLFDLFVLNHMIYLIRL